MSTIKIEKMAGVYSKPDAPKGDYIHLEGSTNDGIHNHLKTIKTEDQYGWLQTEVSGIQLHFRGHTDGKGAVLTTARIRPEDRRWMVNMYGEEAVALVVRHHTI